MSKWEAWREAGYFEDIIAVIFVSAAILLAAGIWALVKSFLLVAFR